MSNKDSGLRGLVKEWRADVSGYSIAINRCADELESILTAADDSHPTAQVAVTVGNPPYADEMTNGECADKLQKFLDVMKENDPAPWPRGMVREVERAVWVLRNPPRTPFICDCKRAPPREHLGRGGCDSVAAAPAAQVADYNVRTSAGLNNACAKMHMKEGQGASDALYELAVKHGAPEAAAAGFAHTVNNAMIALHEQAIDWTQPAAPPAVVVDEAMVKRYLAAQRAYIEQEDSRIGQYRPNAGGLHADIVREACRAGLTAATACRRCEGDGVINVKRGEGSDSVEEQPCPGCGLAAALSQGKDNG